MYTVFILQVQVKEGYVAYMYRIKVFSKLNVNK